MSTQAQHSSSPLPRPGAPAEVLLVALDNPLVHAFTQVASAVGLPIRHFGTRADATRYLEGAPAVTDQGGSRDEVGATAPFSRVEVDGVSLAYNDEGRGPVVVCLHATGHGARDFEQTRAQLKSDYRVIAVDWPGHGRSSHDTQPHGMHRYADLLEGFLTKLGITECAIIGNSVGGGAALIYAARHPERVRGIVLENPAGLAPISAAAVAVMKTFTRFFAAGASGASWYPAAFAAYYRALLPLAPAHAQRARIVAAAVESAPALTQAWASFSKPTGDLRELAPMIATPILVLWATGDQLNRLSRAKPALKRFANARIVTLPGGHSPHLEVPDRFEAAVRDFFRELPPVAKRGRKNGTS
jgi:4,5:9,10-diseco-3-hydroxy-5,9,17-trioxoandrosta-1(10),2-diene-4-oate hydrolase